CIEPLDFVQDEKGLEHCNALLIAAGYQALDDQEARLYGLQKTKTDWGEVPDISNFYGRIQDLETLTQWIVSDKCRFVNVLGMGGIGKTTLSAKLAQDIQNEFHYVMWRSLREAPPVEKILTDAINFFSNNKEIKLQNTLGESITRLIDYLRESRCLLVLDNAESILQSGTFAGRYQAGYEGYAELIKRVAECHHQSCLVLTSREKPKNMLQEGENYPIRSLQLSGLEELAGQQFFTKTDEMIFSEADRKKIIHYYGGNPLALQIVLADIQDWPNEDSLKWIASLEDSLLAFERIEELLDSQFDRLSKPEKVVIYWLAINREPVSLFYLKADIVSRNIKNQVVKTVKSLIRRSLIEKVTDGFTLQNVVMEYCTERLIDKVVEHISQNRLALFNRHALMKATAKDYVRKTQIRLILQPIWESLSNKMGPEGAENHLKQLLSTLQKQSPRKPGYLAGNVLNLLCQMGRDLSSADFSDLTIRQAYLQGMNLHQINFSHSDFAQSVFTRIFGNILCMVFSPDGKRLATGDVNGQIHLWEVDNNEHILTIPAHHYWIYSVAFSSSSRRLASASSDQTVKIWDAENGQCIQILQRTATVFSVNFSPSNENILATAGRNHTVKLWEIEENQCIMQFKHEGTVFSAAFSPNGNKLVSGSDDKLVRIWDTNQGTCLHTLRGHTQSVQSVAFDPKGQWVASGSHDNTVKIWDVNQGECLHTLQEHHNSIWSVVFSPTGQFLASSSEDQTVKIWAIPANQFAKITRFKTLPHDNRVRTIAFSFRDNILASANHDQSVKIWDIRQGSCLNTWQGYSHWIRTLTFSTKEAHLLASGHYDHTVKLWNIRDGKCIHILRGHDNLIGSLAFSPNGQILASASSDRSIKLWNVANGQGIKTFFGHQGPV
ncbi:MAG: NB-ARC domain-containing protein, partial [Candidatus Parabeggiatoa sp.]|nr:NB-ARC domain-containing protein [Candidatus Parabeggiatoa sp.]